MQGTDNPYEKHLPLIDTCAHVLPSSGSVGYAINHTAIRARAANKR